MTGFLQTDVTPPATQCCKSPTADNRRDHIRPKHAADLEDLTNGEYRENAQFQATEDEAQRRQLALWIHYYRSIVMAKPSSRFVLPTMLKVSFRKKDNAISFTKQFVIPSSTSGDTAVSLPNARTEYHHSQPNQQSCAPV